MYSVLLTIILQFLLLNLFAQNKPEAKQGKLIFEADFKKSLDKKEWITEIDSQQGSSVYTKNGKLVVDSKGGVTVWFNKRLKGDIQIEYKRRVLMEGKPNDRLSDLNQFWMAEDPRNSNLFTRTGSFEQYDSLRLYYVGMGGNSNTTTRFRKYKGDGSKPLLQEHADEDHLLKAGKVYHIKILVKSNTTSFWVDGECYFTYEDSMPLREGYFGFRLVHSRQEIWDFKVYQM